MNRRLLAAAAVTVVLISGCGGSRLEATNGYGAPISSVVVSLSGKEFTWENIDPGQTVDSDLPHPVSGIITIDYVSGLNTVSDTLTIPDGCQNASRVSVWIGGDATTIRYEI